MNLTGQAVIDDPFETPEDALQFLRKHIGIFMLCFTAAGNARIDLVELMIAHRDRISAEVKSSSTP